MRPIVIAGIVTVIVMAIVIAIVAWTSMQPKRFDYDAFMRNPSATMTALPDSMKATIAADSTRSAGSGANAKETVAAMAPTLTALAKP